MNLAKCFMSLYVFLHLLKNYNLLFTLVFHFNASFSPSNILECFQILELHNMDIYSCYGVISSGKLKQLKFVFLCFLVCNFTLIGRLSLQAPDGLQWLLHPKTTAY